MKKLKLTKLIAGTLVVASVLALNPIGASAEWRKDDTGWWYSEGNSWAVGWRLIDGKWYYFYEEGYMASNTIIDDYYIDENGVWIQETGVGSDPSQSNGTSVVNGSFKFNKTNGEITKYAGSDTQVIIPSTIDGVKVTRIGGGAFKNCSNLISVTIPDGVTNIGGGSFMNCTSLTNVNIPNTVTRIDTGAFGNCTSLTTITIPDSVTSMGVGAFYNCTNLTNIKANERNTENVKRNITDR